MRKPPGKIDLLIPVKKSLETILTCIEHGESQHTISLAPGTTLCWECFREQVEEFNASGMDFYLHEHHVEFDDPMWKVGPK